MSAIVQSSDIIFEVEDNYQKQTYRNRALIAHSNGKLLLSIPIKHYDPNSLIEGNHHKTKDVIIDNNFPWQSQHWKSLETAYRTSPYFEFYEDDLKPLFFIPESSLLDFNMKIFTLICGLLDISMEFSTTKNYEKKPSCTDLRFLANPKIKQSTYKYLEYIQPYTQVLEANHGFLSNLSILDLLFNEGTNSVSYLESQKLDFL
jgi:hypothetical protein